jgi:hypothetical protein
MMASDERLSDLESRLKSYVSEQLAEMESKLLSAFFTWQETPK